MRVGLGKMWAVLKSAREAIPLAKQAVGAEGNEELFADYHNQSIYQIVQDYTLGTASDVGFGEANIYYTGGGNFLDEDTNPVVFAKGDRITILTIDDLTSELLFTTDGLEFLQHPQETIDLTTYNFRVTGVGCRGNLNFINCRTFSIILEGSGNFLDISTDISQAIYRNGQDVIENGTVTENDTGQNLLYNAHPDENQRGDKTSIANSVYAMDGWIYNKSGAVVSNLKVGIDGPTSSQAGVFVNKCIEVVTATIDPVVDPTNLCTISQCVEGYNILGAVGGYVTLGFWVKSPVTGIHCCSFRNGGSGSGTFLDPNIPSTSFIKEYTVIQADTWEFKIMTVFIGGSGGPWDYSNGTGIIVTWVLSAGTTVQTTKDSWQVGNYIATSNQVNVVGVLGSFKIAIPNLLIGENHQRFVHNNSTVESHLRYYYKTAARRSAFPIYNSTTTLTRECTVELKEAMRAIPTVAFVPSANLTASFVSNIYEDVIEFQGTSSTALSGTWVNSFTADASLYI